MRTNMNNADIIFHFHFVLRNCIVTFNHVLLFWSINRRLQTCKILFLSTTMGEKLNNFYTEETDVCRPVQLRLWIIKYMQVKKKKRLGWIIDPSELFREVGSGGFMNSATSQDFSAQNLLISARRFREQDDDQNLLPNQYRNGFAWAISVF